VALQAPANAALRLGNEIDQFLEDRWLLCLEADLLQGPRLRSLDLAPVSPAAGRVFFWLSVCVRLNEAGCGLFPGLMAAGWQSYQIHSSSVDRDPSSVIAREDSQTAIRRGGTGRETRTSDLLGNGSALRRLFGLACHPRHRPKLSGWQTPQRPRRQRIL
jgi:hypothetical protein